MTVKYKSGMIAIILKYTKDGVTKTIPKNLVNT